MEQITITVNGSSYKNKIGIHLNNYLSVIYVIFGTHQKIQALVPTMGDLKWDN